MKDTAIVNSGSSRWYLVPDAPVSNVNAHAPKVRVGTATSHTQEFEASCELPLDGMPPGLFGHIMLSFRHNLLGIGIMSDKDCKVLLTRSSVISYDKNTKPFLTGWRETYAAKLWRISLKPDLTNVKPCPNDPEDPDNIQEKSTLGVFTVYELTSVEAFVNNFYAAAGYPAQDIWIKEIKTCNYESWSGLTYNNAAKYCPSVDETIKGNMVQTCQTVCSNKHNKKESEVDRIKKIHRSKLRNKEGGITQGIARDGRASTRE